MSLDYPNLIDSPFGVETVILDITRLKGKGKKCEASYHMLYAISLFYDFVASYRISFSISLWDSQHIKFFVVKSFFLEYSDLKYPLRYKAPT